MVRSILLLKFLVEIFLRLLLLSAGGNDLLLFIMVIVREPLKSDRCCSAKNFIVNRNKLLLIIA